MNLNFEGVKSAEVLAESRLITIIGLQPEDREESATIGHLLEVNVLCHHH